MRKNFINWRENRIAYLDVGKGPPVIFIHGFPTGAFLWEKVVERLSASFRCIAPDLMGFGDTEIVESQYLNMSTQAEMILGLMDSLDIGKAAIVAHDQGGAAAQVIATKHLSRLSALVLADSVAFDNWPVAGVKFIKKIASLPILGQWIVTSPLVRKLATALGGGIKSGFHDPAIVTDEILSLFGQVSRSSQSQRNYLRYIADMDNRCTTEAAPLLKNITVPAMIVWGGDDRMIDVTWANRLASEIPGAKKPVIIGNCGHFSPLEKPVEFSDILLEFLPRR